MVSHEYTVPEQTKKLLNCIEQIKKINGDTLFNYSIGESMEFALSEWQTEEKIIECVRSKKIEYSDFGDIYARKNS
ncbi:hypothetical protein Barb6_00221 [Bacteroidales bacterium Barb6]|nr:hypothetical protein Barb6_00221 [Bacteroidales bacterium Barb6]